MVTLMPREQVSQMGFASRRSKGIEHSAGDGFLSWFADAAHASVSGQRP